jgi:hypothetical protein
MSLDVYLTIPQSVPSGSGIFVRENGSTRELTRAEWDEKFPGREPAVVHDDLDSHEIYSANITHNLGRMASEAGVYMALWRPDEIGITHAHQLIPLLREGLALLQGDPDKFQQFNPSNGWGDYDGLVQFVENYIRACEAHPDAVVGVSR